MRTHQAECIATTSTAPDLVDVTPEVEGAVHESGIVEGQVTVFSRHPCCSVLVNERESGLWDDVKRTLERLGATDPADRRTLLASTSVTVPFSEGRLRLGTWQRVLAIELEAGCSRSLSIHVVGE